MVDCPICGKPVKESLINQHIDSNCTLAVSDTTNNVPPASTAPIFRTPTTKSNLTLPPDGSATVKKRSFTDSFGEESDDKSGGVSIASPNVAKKSKTNPLDKVAPLAERMRPKSLDEVYGQNLVGKDGILRGLIENDRVPSMILWGPAGTGKTSIARLIAQHVNARFAEINSASSGVAECKKLFAEARSELGLTGRKTIIFCDEIHRFSKSQQDVFLPVVEAGLVTLIGSTNSNPSFSIISALLSRCRVFTIAKLSASDISAILSKALKQSDEVYKPNTDLINEALLEYLASFADGDARTALNLLELAMDLSVRPRMTLDLLKSSLTKTLVYDRSGKSPKPPFSSTAH